MEGPRFVNVDPDFVFVHTDNTIRRKTQGNVIFRLTAVPWVIQQIKCYIPGGVALITEAHVCIRAPSVNYNFRHERSDIQGGIVFPVPETVRPRIVLWSESYMYQYFFKDRRPK